MMKPAQEMLYDLVGRPPIEGAKGKLVKDEPAVCQITGMMSPHTADLRKALGENFTDHSLWSATTGRVGEAALWCCSGKGKASPRMWSWVIAPGVDLPSSHEKAPHRVQGVCQTNRSNTRPIIDILSNPPVSPWVCCIATSGQKHVLPYATTNPGNGAWQVRMEDTTINSTPREFRTVFNLVLALRRLGVPADHIKMGTPGHMLKTHEQVQEWRKLSNRLRPYHTSPVTDLALWCVTKPIMEDINAYPNP